VARERIDLDWRAGRGTAERLGAANPASVLCAKSGGKTEIRKGPRGQYCVCRLPDGRVVDEWAYFRAMRAKRSR